MSEKAKISKNNKYWIPEEAYHCARHYARRYKEFLDEHDYLIDTLTGVSYDSQPHGSGISKPTEGAAIRASIIMSKVQLIEKMATEVTKKEPAMYRYILKGVTEKVNYGNLRDSGMPCSREKYQNMKREFYWRLAREI